MALLKDKKISPTYYSKIAQAESGNNPNAKNPGKGQTASGLYQFTAGTWNGMVKELGLNYTLEDRFNPEKSKIVMEAFTKKNASYLQKNLGRELNDADLYMAHFLGPGGASTFLKDLSTNPNAGVNMSGEVINANKNVFYKKNGQLRTNKEVYEEMGKRINQPTNITNQAVENSHPEVPNISNGLTNFEGQYSLPTFASNEKEPKKTKEEEVVEQKTNELNLLKDFYTGRTQIQPQQEQMIEEAPQEIPSMDVMGEFNQISNFLEQAREGGFFEGWAFETMQQGGEIKTTPYGQWEFPNQITKVPSNNITMENVPRALMGIADTGEQRIMLPEEKNHIFEGATEVTEVPLSFAQLYKIKTGKELK